jgi:hypothetical protein
MSAARGVRDSVTDPLAITRVQSDEVLLALRYGFDWLGFARERPADSSSGSSGSPPRSAPGFAVR